MNGHDVIPEPLPPIPYITVEEINAVKGAIPEDMSDAVISKRDQPVIIAIERLRRQVHLLTSAVVPMSQHTRQNTETLKELSIYKKRIMWLGRGFFFLLGIVTTKTIENLLENALK